MGFFRKLMAGYAVLLFLAMMALSLPYLVLNMMLTPGKRALRRNIHYLHHPFTAVFLALIGVRLRVEGAEKLGRHQSYVIVSNHRSSLDFIVNAHAFPGVFRFLAKQELLKVPVFGWVVGKMCLIVDRRSAASRRRSVGDLKQQLAAGWSIFIYPEGGRNRSEEPLAPFYDGAFRIAMETGAPLALQVITNIQEVAPETLSIDLRPGRLRIVWDDPIETAGMTSADLPALKETVRRRMLHHLGVVPAPSVADSNIKTTNS
jgi:1-acyl-sn-glycerol-3-phosphate acyltransferase